MILRYALRQDSLSRIKMFLDAIEFITARIPET
jgi:hypothetical protein